MDLGPIYIHTQLSHRPRNLPREVASHEPLGLAKIASGGCYTGWPTKNATHSVNNLENEGAN